MADNKITVTLTAKNDLTGSLASAGHELQDFASKADAIGSRFEAAGLRIGAMGLAANAGLSRMGLDLKSVVDSSLDAQKALFGIASTAGINGAAAESIAGKWSSALGQISKETNQTTAQLITAFQDMVAKGISEQDALKMLAPIGKAATATNSSIRDIAVTVSASFSKMEISGERVAKVLDVMAAAGDAGAFELKDMAQYMDMLTAKSASLGAKGEASMTQLAAAAQLARMGTGDAASAANNLANWLDKLNASSTAKTFNDIGVDLEKLKQNARASGDFIGYMISEIKKITGGDTAKIAKLFPDVQAGSFAQIATQNFKEYVDIAQKAGEATGVVNEKFDTMMLTTSEKLKSVQINLSSAIEGSKVVQGLLSSLDGLGKWAAEHPEIAGFIGIGAATTAAVGLAGGAIVAGIGATITAVGALSSAVIGLGGLLAANPVVAALFGAATVATFVYTHWDDVTAYFQSWWGNIKSLFTDGGESVKQALLNLTPLGIVAKGFDALGQYFSGLVAKWKIAGSNMIGALLSGIWEGIQSLPFGIGAKITEAVRYVGNFARDWWNAGKNLMSSLLDGIKSKYNDIVGSIKRLGLDMSSAIGIKSAAAAEKEWTGSFGVMKRPAASGSVAPAPLSASAPKFQNYLTLPTEKNAKVNPLIAEGIALTAQMRTEEEKAAVAMSKYKQLLDAKAISMETYNRAMSALDKTSEQMQKTMAEGAALTASMRTKQEQAADATKRYKELLDANAISLETYQRAVASVSEVTGNFRDIMQEGANLTASLRTEQEKALDALVHYKELLAANAISLETYARALATLDKSAEASRKRMEEGASLTASLRTEQELTSAAMSRYQELLDTGAISAETYGRAMARLSTLSEDARKAIDEGASLTASMRTEQEKAADAAARYSELLDTNVISLETFQRAMLSLGNDSGTNEIKKMLDEGASLTASLRTEQELTSSAMTRYQELLDAGAISAETYGRAMAKLSTLSEDVRKAIEEGASLTASMRTEQEKAADAAARYSELLDMNVISLETFQRAMLSLGVDSGAENLKKMMDDGASLTASLRTEQESSAAAMVRYQELLDAGAISAEIYGRAVEKLSILSADVRQAIDEGASLTASMRTEQEKAADAAARYSELLDMNVISLETFQRAMLSLGNDSGANEIKKLMDEGASLTASLRTEQELTSAAMTRYQELLDAGAISAEVYGRAMAKLSTLSEDVRKAIDEGAFLTASMRTEQEKAADAAARYSELLDMNVISLETFQRAMLSLGNDSGVNEIKKMMDEGASLTASLRTEQEKSTETMARYTRLFEVGAISMETYQRALAATDNSAEKLRKTMDEGASLTASLRTEQEVVNDEMERFQGLLSAGAISAETYERAIASLDKSSNSFSRMMQEGASLTASMRTEQEKTADAIQRYTQLLDAGAISQETFNRAVASLGSGAAQKLADDFEQKSRSIERSLTDALLRGFESGKGFAQNLRDTLKNMFSTLILRPIIQPIAQAGSNIIMGLLGMGGSATSMAAGLGGGAGGSGIGDALSLASSLKDAWKFASNYFSGSSAAAAAPNYYAVSPLGSTPSGGAAGAAVGNPALATAAQYLGAAAAGFVIGKMISGGYSALGKSGNAAVMIGTAVGAFGGPIGMIIGGAIGGLVNRLFGRKLKEVGIQGTFSGEGFSGEQYRYEKGGLFRSSRTTTSPLDAALDESMDKSYQSLKLSAITLGNVFMDTSKSLDNFSYSIKLNFLGLDAEASNKLIEGELTKMGDAMASVILADIARAEMATAGIATDLASDVEQYWQDFARAGESSTETLTRLSGSLAGVNGWMDRLGMTMYDTTLAAGDMASELVDLFGSMDKFSQSMQSYTERYYTSAERLQMGTADLQQKFDDLGLTMPGTIEEFRALVEAQDLTTESGRNTYASLIGLNEAFYGVAQAGNFAALNGRTLMEAWKAQTSIVDGLISSYDGSVAAQQTLADAARSRYQVELALVKQIDAALSSTHTMFLSTIEEMKFSTLDTAGKYDFLQAKSSELENLLRASTDPVEIKSLAEQLNQVSRDAWMLLGDDEKRIKIDAYEEYLNELDTLTAAQLAKVKQNIDDNGGGQDSAKDAIADAIASALAAHTGKLMEAALIMKSAADKPVKLEQKVTVDVNVDMPSNVEVGIQ